MNFAPRDWEFSRQASSLDNGPLEFASYYGCRITGQARNGKLLEWPQPRKDGAVLYRDTYSLVPDEDRVAVGPNLMDGEGPAGTRVEATLSYRRLDGLLYANAPELAGGFGVYLRAFQSGWFSNQFSAGIECNGASKGAWFFEAVTDGTADGMLLRLAWRQSSGVVVEAVSPALGQHNGTLFREMGLRLEVEPFGESEVFRCFVRDTSFFVPASGGGTGWAIDPADPNVTLGPVIDGQRLVTVAGGWVQVMSATLNETGVDPRHGQGVFGCDIIDTVDGAVATVVRRITVREQQSGDVLWDDDLARPAAALTRLETGVPVFGEARNLSSVWSGDCDSRAPTLTSDPTDLQLSEVSLTPGVSHANPFVVLNRLSDDDRSQRREARWQRNAGTGRYGLMQRVSFVAPDTEGPATWPEVTGYLALADPSADALYVYRVKDSALTQMARADAVGLPSVSLYATLDLSVYDFEIDVGETAPVALMVRLNGAALTWATVAADVTDLGDGRLIDYAAERITSGRYEGLYVEGNGQSTDWWRQGELEGPTAPPEPETVPSIEVRSEEKDAVSAPLNVNVQWNVTRVSIGASAQQRVTSGRVRTVSFDSHVRDRWLFVGLVTEAERDALLAYFRATRFAELPFVWNPALHVDGKGLTEGFYKLVSGTLNYRRARSGATEPHFYFQFEVLRLRGDPR